MTDTDGRETSRGRPSKVARLIEEYGLDGMGAELERRWTAEEDRQSLRDLATYFNHQLLSRALADAEIRVLDGEIENMYRLLTADGSTDQMRIRRRLERDGLDVETLERDFVTYQAIRTYLKKYRNAEYSPKEVDPIEREIENIQQLQGRVTSVTEGKIKQLRNKERITMGSFRTLVDIRVVCEDCNTQYDAIELLRRGSCECSENTE